MKNKRNFVLMRNTLSNDMTLRKGLLFGLSFLVIGFLSAACSPGFSTSQVSSKSNNSSQIDTSIPIDNPLAVDGTIGGGRFNNAQVLKLDLQNKLLEVRVPFLPGISLGAFSAVSIPQVSGASVGLETMPDGALSLVIKIPLDKVMRGVTGLPKGKLPNGDRLPSIPDGELPSVGLQIDKNGAIKGSLYLSPTVIGIFVATKFDPFISLTLPIRNQSRTVTYGYFTSVPAKAGFDGGFFMSIALPDDLARAIDGIL